MILGVGKSFKNDLVLSSPLLSNCHTIRRKLFLACVLQVYISLSAWIFLTPDKLRFGLLYL